MTLNTLLTVLIIGGVVLAVLYIVFIQYRRTLQEAKNYERALKMTSLKIHIPPASEDIEGNGRDERDLTEEILSQTQVMYNILSSTAQKGFKSSIYGQRHVSFEVVSHQGLINYYVVTPTVLIEAVKQSVAASYPSARLEIVDDHTIFSPTGKIQGTVGGEFTLKKHFSYPIATYQESKRDTSRAILNALAAAGKEDGVAIQMLIRPASTGWSKSALSTASSIKKNKGKASGASFITNGLLELLWKPPQTSEVKPEDKQLSSIDQATVDAIEEKTRYPGYETLIRVVVSTTTRERSEGILKNVLAAFSLFDSATNNGFKFSPSKNVEELATAYIFRFFPQSITQNILNAVELSTIFHLPTQNTIPTSQVQRQLSKQVDGPTETMDEGFLLGYNEFRGVKKEIRLGTNDRRRHTYIIGQTGTGKSKLLENLAFQDMMDGRGFAFIDPHGDSAEELLGMVPKERVEDVIYFSPGDMDMPVGLNLFEFDNQDQQDFLIQESISMLYKLYDPGHTGIIGPRFESWFRNGAKTVMADPAGSSFLDVQQVFIDQAFADEKIKHVTSRTVLDFWNKEMAQTPESAKGEILGWFASKFGAFLGNDMLRNIIGQTKSGFDLREIMDGKKILLVNLSKGRLGELNTQLLGMMFVMKFQAAAMGRADMPENEREDFSLYVDEFQNFATESFASILSEARKYRLNLILANQFMTQLTDQIREAILGNIGTVISGRIGITDAEILQKKFMPTFDAEDLTKLPNYHTIASVMIQGMPSSPFSMALLPPVGTSNPQLKDALKRLSAAKYGKPRAQVEREIFARLGAGDEAKKAKLEALKKAQEARIQGAVPGAAGMSQASSGSFLDEWLAKKKATSPAVPQAPQQISYQRTAPITQQSPEISPMPTSGAVNAHAGMGPADTQQHPQRPLHDPTAHESNHLRVHKNDKSTNSSHEVSIKLRSEE